MFTLRTTFAAMAIACCASPALAQRNCPTQGSAGTASGLGQARAGIGTSGSLANAALLQQMYQQQLLARQQQQLQAAYLQQQAAQQANSNSSASSDTKPAKPTRAERLAAAKAKKLAANQAKRMAPAR